MHDDPAGMHEPLMISKVLVVALLGVETVAMIPGNVLSNAVSRYILSEEVLVAKKPAAFVVDGKMPDPRRLYKTLVLLRP